MRHALSVLFIAVLLALTVFACLPPLPTHAAGLTITAKTPATNALNIEVTANIVVTFSGSIDQATVTAGTFNVDGSISGRISGLLTAIIRG